ncbi:MAG: hypothetical protein JWO40_690 [Candidatus Doudnabacteria bacterium]|nr:hypothetical protein [Candidatus Doudnabacteria bacterium]
MFYDIGIGILLSLGLANLFDTHLTASWIILGVVFSLIPDLDYLFHLQKGGSTKNAHEHRDYWHYPVVFIPFGMLLIALLANWHYAVLFLFATLLHFIHDSIGIGWGVQWLYPFNSNHYSFFYHYEPSDRRLARKNLYIWNHDEINTLSKKHGDDEWVKNIYFKLHPYGLIEYAVFIIALVILIFVIG